MDERTSGSLDEGEGWHTAGEAVRVSFRPSTLCRTVVIALIVGTLLSVVNQADVIVRGDADAVTWARIVVNYLVPFCVSTAGFLSACRLRD
jgi:hypothetical protein